MYAVHYLRSTTSHGIAYHSSASAATSAYVHFPPASDREAYTDHIPESDTPGLRGFCDANRGSQIGDAGACGLADGFKCCSNQLWLFKVLRPW